MGTQEDVVLVETADRVATVTLNRPHHLNAMTAEMHGRYCSLMADLDANPDVRVIVVTGAGRGFCAGADLVANSVFGGTDSEGGRAAAPLDAPLNMHTPVIAAINGPSAGMGTAYALMADVRYAGRSARIGTTFARLGLVAEWGMAHNLVAAVGQSAAAELLLSGRYVEADEALSLGLVTRVLPDDELLPAAQAWAREVADGTSPHSHAVMKDQLRAVANGESVEEGFRRSLELMRESFDWPDLMGAVAAFKEKRPPTFPPYVRP
ncbi:MAG TPA: enoyl-CoA hydratase-related protein [Mycobacteriales bacterium]